MKQYRNVALSPESKERLDYLASVTSKSRSQLIAEILEPLYEIAVSLKPCHGCKRINMQISDSILSQSVTIQLLGRSIIITGHFSSDESDKVVDAKIKEECEKVIENE